MYDNSTCVSLSVCNFRLLSIAPLKIVRISVHLEHCKQILPHNDHNNSACTLTTAIVVVIADQSFKVASNVLSELEK